MNLKLQMNQIFGTEFAFGKLFDTEGETKQHIKRHESIDHVCDICNLVCSTKFTLHRHMVEQHNCFQNKSDMITNTFEEAKKEFVCPHCARSYKHERNLNEHIKESHGSTEKSKFPCQVCGYKFSSKFNRKVHMNEQHGITQFDDCVISKEAKTFSCSICNMVFQRKSNLKAHELTHTNQEKFICDECGKQFTSQTILNRHRKVHVAEWPRYDC